MALSDHGAHGAWIVAAATVATVVASVVASGAQQWVIRDGTCKNRTATSGASLPSRARSEFVNPSDWCSVRTGNPDVCGTLCRRFCVCEHCKTLRLLFEIM